MRRATAATASLLVSLLAATVVPAPAAAQFLGPGQDADPLRTEFAAFPSLGYSTDNGLGFGITGAVARFVPGFDPYRWRLGFQASASLKAEPGGRVGIPTSDSYLLLEQPGLADGRVRLRVELSLRHQINAGYWGLGNASRDERPWEVIDPDVDPDAFDAAIRHNQYRRTYPGARADAWIELPGALRAFVGGSLVWNWMTVYPGSVLERDRDGGAGAVVADALAGTARHGVLEAYGGVMVDTRDHEYTPTRGVFADASLRGGPVFEDPAGYLGVNLTLRGFTRIWGPYLVLGARVIGDVIVGKPPFYELARHGGVYPEYGPGGGMTLRGAPKMRYHGAAKLIANVELRAKLWFFRLFRERWNLGAVLFADAGRVWAQLRPAPGLDGAGAGLKYGLGGGLRLQIGETFIVRGDVGWSPDGTGVYLGVNQVF